MTIKGRENEPFHRIEVSILYCMDDPTQVDKSKCASAAKVNLLIQQLYWNLRMVYFTFGMSQIDMKNQEQPVQKVFENQLLYLSSRERNEMTLELAINEFTDNNNTFGFLTSEPEPYEFLSINKVQEKTWNADYPNFKL